jgi:FeS assembly SUF system regulator
MIGRNSDRFGPISEAMVRISRLADYGIVLMAHLARHRGARFHSAKDVAKATGVPAPTAAKILKALTHRGLLESHRGIDGGFALSRDPATVSVADVVTGLDGPIAMTACQGGPDRHVCGIESSCPTRSNWDRINDAVRGALAGLSIAEMATPSFTFPRRTGGDGVPASAPAAARDGSPS